VKGSPGVFRVKTFMKNDEWGFALTNAKMTFAEIGVDKSVVGPGIHYAPRNRHALDPLLN